MPRTLKLSALVALVAYAGSAAAVLWKRQQPSRRLTM